MKQLILTLLLVGTTVISYAQKKESYKVEIQTSAICEMCQYAIEYELSYTKGVKNATLDLETKKVLVEYNDKKISPEQIRKAITMVGYHADDMERDPEAYKKLPACCKDGAHENDHH